MDEIYHYKIRWNWRDRQGVKRQTGWYEVAGSLHTAILLVRTEAMRVDGYPGHEGGWWNWFVDDVCDWLHRRGWCKDW